MKVIRKTDFGLLKFKDITAITSKVVADALGVRHGDLMRNVKKAEKYLKSHYAELRSENPHFNPIFEDYEYTNKRGRTYACKLMNEDAVKVLIKVVDTQEAFNYFVKLMNEFNKMKMERIARQEVINPTKTLNSLLSILQEMLKEELPKSKKPELIFVHVQNAINGAVAGKNKKLNRELLNHLELEEIDYLERLFIARIVARIPLGFTAEQIRSDVLDLAKELKKI